ncbi:hypothetical protein [Phascolarctobacterium succinatutens]|uniref:hypothetical protein n=1 Tax=Phascolarctobacterium succinatutens TaxID=626940 RepID=UPI0026F242A4|nr:hypothetical protein [Phascolarctobacterium succinatutens]
MKIAGYQGSVNLGTGGGATVKVSSDLNAYGSGGKGLAAIAGAANKWAVAVEAQQEDEDKQSILNAMDIFNKSRYNIMYNDESGLMNTKLEGTAGAGASYTEQINKARQDVLSNTKLHSQKNQLALDHLMYQSAQQGFQTVDQYEQKQKEAVTDLRYDNNIQNSCEFVQKNWNNPQALQDEIIRTQLLTSAIYGKRGAEFIESKSRANIGQVVASAVGASITNEDYGTMRNIMDKYGSYLTANQRAAFEKVAYDKESSAFERNTAKDLYAKYGDDEEAVRKEVENMDAFSPEGGKVETQAEGTTWVRNSGVSLDGVKQQVTIGLSDIAKEFNTLSGAQLIVTSGTDSTDIHAAGEHSHGAGVKLDVAADWLENADNRKKFISYMQSKGIKVLDEYSNPSPNSTGGHLDLDFTDYKGGTVAHKHISLDEQDRIMKQYRTIKADHDRIETYKKNKLFEGIKSEIFAMFNKGTSYSEAMTWATNQAGSDPDKYVTYRNAVVAIYGPQGRSGSSGSGGSSNGKLDDDAIGVLEDMLQEGKFSSIDQFLAYAAKKGASSAQRGKLEKIYNDWYNGTGEFAFDMEGLVQQVAGKNADALYKKKIQNYGRQWVRAYRAKNHGMNPGETELLEALQNCVTTKVYGSYVTEKHSFWFDSTEDIKASDADLIARGIASVTKTGDDWYDVKWLDGTSGKINGAYLAKLLKGDY